MNKNELISAMSGASNLTQAQCTEALQTLINTVTAELKKGSDVKIIGFGTFKISSVLVFTFSKLEGVSARALQFKPPSILCSQTTKS